MSNKKVDASSSQKLINDNDGVRNVKTPRKRQKRYNAKCGNGKKIDVQLTTKMYENAAAASAATFSPKKMQIVKNASSKKHQRYQYGKTRI
jgi:hypothetical protein